MRRTAVQSPSGASAPTREWAPESDGPVRARADYAWAAALVLLTLVLTTLGVVNGPSMSAFDEHTHLDYAWKIRNGELPHEGSELSGYTLQEWSCRGQANIEMAFPPCETAATADPAGFPGNGESYNYWHPPGYYAVTAAVAGAADALPLGLTFTTAARLSGGLWLAAAVVAMYAVVRRWRLPRWLAAAAAATMLGIPSLVHASTTVTNDAPAALIGVAALWILTRVFLQHRLGWAVPTVVAVLAASTKLMSTVAILTVLGLVGLSALAAWRDGRRPEAWRKLLVAGVPTLGIAAVALGWSAFQARRAEPNWSNPLEGLNTAEVVGLPFDEWASSVTSTFGIVGDYWLQPSLSSMAIVAWVGVLGVLFTAAPLAGIVAYDRDDVRRWLGWAALIGVAAVPLLVQARELASGGYFPHVTSRYAITLVPITIATLAVLARARRFRAAAVAVPVLGYLAMVLSFAGVF